MPELPEVETVKNHLNKVIKNKIIDDVLILRHNIIEGDEIKFVNTLKGKKILEVNRLGKFLIFNLTGDNVLISHLRMEGKFILGNNLEDKSKYARVVFLFKDKTILNYDDSRTFGLMTLRNKKDYLDVPPLSLLGPEANLNINVDDMYPIIHKDKRYIKEVLLDQHIISGLGNIYVDETLFASKISPLSRANCISKTDVKNILENAKAILNKAIINNGTTVHTFTWDEGKSGNFQSFLKVYGKKGEVCPNCGNNFVKTKLKGRGTTYCPFCQKLKTDKYVLGITGPVSSGKSTALFIAKKLGYKTFSCDEEVAKLYKDDSFKTKVNKLFGTSDKNKIRNIVSESESKLDKLNRLIHPIIIEEMKQFIKNNSGKLFIEVPLLFQLNLNSLFDEIVLILSSKNNSLIKNRGNIGKKQQKINEKYNYQKYINRATYIVRNNQSLNIFKNKIKTVLSK